MLSEEDAAQSSVRVGTRRRRLEDPGEDPAIWYDTLVLDWVIHIRMPDCAETMLLPLGVHWFDADWAACTRQRASPAATMQLLAELS